MLKVEKAFGRISGSTDGLIICIYVSFLMFWIAGGLVDHPWENLGSTKQVFAWSNVIIVHVVLTGVGMISIEQPGGGVQDEPNQPTDSLRGPPPTHLVMFGK